MSRCWFFNFRCVKDPGGERHWWWWSTTRFPGGDAGGAESNGCHRRRGCRHDDGLSRRRSDIVTPTTDLSNKGPFTIQRCNCTPDLELSANWGLFQTRTDDMLEQTNPVVYWFMMVKTYQLWVIMALSHMKHMIIYLHTLSVDFYPNWVFRFTFSCLYMILFVISE